MAQCRAGVRIIGRVQGVGFRYSTTRAAERNNLTGWCRNNPDGSVEAVFEGARNDIETAIAWCRKGPPGARVDNVDVSWGEATGEFSSFSIAG